MKTFTRLLLVLCFAALPRMVYAEDIEIYMNPQMAAGSEPLVMFSIDYRPNLGSSVADRSDFFVPILGADDPDIPAGGWTFFDYIRLSLKVVFKELSGVQVGLMLNHDFSNNCEGPANAISKSNTNNNCSNGGYIAMGFQSLGEQSTKDRFAEILRHIPIPQGNQSHSWQGKELFFEFFRYLTGGDVWNGRNGFRDYAGDRAKNLDAEFPKIAWDTDIMEFVQTVGTGSSAYPLYRYQSPLDAATHCTRIFTVNLMFSVSNQDSNSDEAIRASRADGGMGGINLQGSTNDVSTVIKYLYDVDLGDGTFGVVPELNGKQNVVSYFVMTRTNFQPNGYRYATAGGTGLPIELASDPEDLIDTLTNIFQQILSVSTTFVAASVPVNVFNRSEIVDNVYIALFQADPDRKPAWPGSLKKLKIEQSGNVVRLVDQLGNDAVAADGRVNHAALTFWTDGTALPEPRPEQNEVDGRDGRSVDRGGAGQRIPGFLTTGPGTTNASGPRRVYTDPNGFTNGTLTELHDLDADSATATALRPHLGVATDAEALEMLKWVRGMDVDNLRGTDPHQPTIARPWLLGDPLHSRPLPVNFGGINGHTHQNPDIRILMGSNDGFLRMFRNTTAEGADLGEEVWAFMPRSVMDKMPILRANTPLPADVSPHPYTVDGAPVVYVKDVNGNGTIDDGDTVVAFIGLRRGGRAYYALDISNPDQPRIRWRIQGGETGFEELGLSFATPQVGYVRIDGERVPVVVLSGGYDTNKDTRPGPGTDDSMGNAVFIVNALTGELVWKVRGGASTGMVSSTVYQHADMVDSIPSDATAVDTTGDGFIDRVYVADTGGTVWRLDMPRDLATGDSDTGTWTASVLAFLGRHYTSSVQHDRRFFHAPDVVLSRDSDGSAFDAVIVGSGNRENPLDRPDGGAVTENWLYMIKDRAIHSGTPPTVAYDHESFGDVTDNCLQLETCGESPPDLENGWRLGLEETLGEKSLAVPFTISGTIFFTTYLPPGSNETATCGPAEGGGMLYAVALADARSTINFDTSDDDPDRPGEPTSRSDRSRQLRSGGIPAEVVSLPPNRILLPDLSTEAVPGSMRWRTFWYENENPNGI